MNSTKILHNISHLKWVFLLGVIVLLFYSFIALPENLITIIGILIFLAGIHLGLDSLSDVGKLSEKRLKPYRNKKLVRKFGRIILFSILLLIIVSSLFISLRFIFPAQSNNIFIEFFNLGLDCWALILGLLCSLKSLEDKQIYANTHE